MQIGKKTVKLEIKHDKIRDQLAALVSSTDGFALHKGDANAKADLLILEMCDDPAKDFEYLERIKAQGSASDFFLTSKNVNPEILLQTLRMGVKEFLPQPIKEADVRAALAKIRDRGETTPSIIAGGQQRKGEIIDVIGSKGGVGTTTVAVNLATTLAEMDREKSVALIDMNLLFGEVPLFLSIESAFDWMEVAKNIARIDSTYLLSVMSRHESGVHVLPSPAKVIEEYRVAPQVIEALLVQMRSMFDFIVIDSGQSLDEISKTILRLSDSLSIVTLLSLPCLINVKRLLDTFQKFGYPLEPNIHILVNRYHKRSIITLDDAEKSLKKKVFWNIPNDFQTTMSAINQGKPLAVMDPVSEINISFKELAALVSGKGLKKKSFLPWR